MSPTFGDRATNALRYWEPRRLIYNLVLAGVVAGHVAASWPASKAVLAPDTILWLFMMAVLANIAYCAAYAVDLFVQHSEFGATWPRRRWIVLVLGVAFAAVIAHFFITGMIANGGLGHRPHGAPR